jgi:hypothetical protein
VLDPSNSATLATIDLTNGNLLYWVATDASGNQLACATLADAIALDVAQSPFPAAVGFLPWPFGANHGLPQGFSYASDPQWPLRGPPPVAATVPVIGTVPPGTGQGGSLL